VGNSNVGSQTVRGNQTVQGQATINKLAGNLTVQSVATAGTACSPNGRIARDRNGLLLSCQSGRWKQAQGMSGFKIVPGNYSISFAKIFMCYSGNRWWAMRGGGNVSSVRHSNGRIYMTYKGDFVAWCDQLLIMP
jgi:hypothetical protein